MLLLNHPFELVHLRTLWIGVFPENFWGLRCVHWRHDGEMIAVREKELKPSRMLVNDAVLIFT